MLIVELTKYQKSRIPKIREYWRSVGLSTDPTDIAYARKVVSDVYATAGKERPEFVFVLESPMACAMAIAMLRIDKKLSDQLRDQLSDQLRAQLSDQLSDQLRAQLRAQLSDLLGILWRWYWLMGSTDAWWLSYFKFAGSLAEYSPGQRARLDAYEKMVKTVF